MLCLQLAATCEGLANDFEQPGSKSDVGVGLAIRLKVSCLGILKGFYEWFLGESVLCRVS